MRLDRTPLTVLLLLTAVAAIQMVHYYPLLPERLAVHFGASGEPNGWSSKSEFMVLFGAMEAFFILFGVGLALALGRIPVALLNVRNKDYWFSPERREESLGDAPPRLSGDFWYVMIVFVVAVLWLGLQIVLRFRAPKEQPPL